MVDLQDYMFEPILKFDWFLPELSNDGFDDELEYYKSMGKVMQIVRSDKEDWEKLVELGFHEFNMNLMLRKNIIFDYKYADVESKKLDALFDGIAGGIVNPNDFISYMISVRNSLEKELMIVAKRVGDDLSQSGLLFAFNDTNKFIHCEQNATPIFYKNESNEIDILSFRCDTDSELYLNYSKLASFCGEDCAPKFKRFVHKKSTFFDKSSSVIIYTLSDCDIKHAAGLFYATFIFNCWINDDEFNVRIISDILAKIDTLDYCLSFSDDEDM